MTTIAKLDDGTEEWGGYEYRLFEAAAQHLNFDFDIGPPLVCCVWGKGSWNSFMTTSVINRLLLGEKLS